MAETWAICGVDLHVELGRTRVRESLERALREAVQSGRLVSGTLLPPSRTLASDLGLARNTVAEAYAQLVAEGWLTSRQGSGTRVAERGAEPRPSPGSPVARPPAVRYDLRPGYPDVTSFPRGEWLAADRAALSRAPAEAFGYGDPRGRPELRAALAGYLARARGVWVSPDTVVVCSGFSQALWLLGRVMRSEGRSTIGVESYGHRHHRELLADTGLQVVGLPVDGHGARPADLERLDAVLLTPAHQFPLGVALESARRTRFVQWASTSGALVIEDDYDGEFRYDRRAVGAMQALSPDRVVYAGTASKTLAPGLRLAWLVVPADLVAKLVEQRSLVDRHSAVLDQLTMAEFINSGRYDRHVRRSRLAYRRRRDRLLATLSRKAPDVTVHGLPAGLHAVVGLPAGDNEADVVARAAARGLALEGLSGYAVEPDERPPALVVGYATPPAHAYTGALARLCATLAE
ncbi:MAG: PLP-dependent aminotransferase family protein [Acidimicrobiales bacterium]|jgi:GntR family transcriptional regulator/MocR family aminotransferase